LCSFQAQSYILLLIPGMISVDSKHRRITEKRGGENKREIKET
jgi:hypothetical protein